MVKPKIIAAEANVEYAELQGIVTVGEETAKLLSKKLGRKVEAGEQFDLGTLAVFHKNRWKNFKENLKIKKNIFTNLR
jgi:hypothetical protein